MSYSFNYDLGKLPRGFFKEVAKVVNKRKLHTKLGSASKVIVRKFRVNKLLGIQLEDAISVVEDLTDVYVKNLVHNDKFRKSKQKVLLLPHCCRKYMDSRCKARFDTKYSSYFCNHCSKDCLANKATRLAKKEGYKVFIMPGGSGIKKILDRVSCDAILGIACPEELKLGIKLAESRKKTVKAIPLTKNGCSKTRFNMETLRNELN